MRRNILIAILAPLGILAADAALAAPKSANGPLLKLFETTWQEDLADKPLEATQLGDPRFNDKLPDMSKAAIDARLKRRFRMAAIGWPAASETKRSPDRISTESSLAGCRTALTCTSSGKGLRK